MTGSELITAAIEEVLNPTAKLSDVLLKLKAIAYLTENSDLRTWVENELNGYYGSEIVPEYRKVGAIVKGNLTTRMGNAWQNNQTLLTEYMGLEFHDHITHRFLNHSVAELELLADSTGKQGELQVVIPHAIHRDITKTVYQANGWYIHSAWQLFSPNSLQGVLSSIKSKILDILMPIKVAFGDNIPLQSLQQKQSVNEKLNQALHSINVANGGIVNVATGDASVQATNAGQGSINAAAGTNITQSISGEQSTSLQELIRQIKNVVDSEPTFDDQREDMQEELKRVDVQLKREEPKKSIIKRSFESLKDLAAGTAGTAAGHAVFEMIKQGMDLTQ